MRLWGAPSADERSLAGRRLACVALLLAASCIGCRQQSVEQADPEPAGKVYRIGITQIATHPGIDAVRSGFLGEMNQQGFRRGVNVRYEVQNANGDFPTAQAIARRFAAANLDLIFSISTPSTQACLEAVRGDTPIVFGAITDPLSAGIVGSLERPGGNVTGTTDRWPYRAQFRLLRRLVPGVRRVGVLHNPAEANSRASMDLVRDAAGSVGMALTEVSVSNSNEVPAAARSLVGRVDAIYIPADNTVISAIAAVVGVAERNGIPLMPGDASNVAVGGFGTIGHDYASIGAESARIAARILGGEPPGNIAVRTGTTMNYYFNLQSARAQGVLIPPDLLQRAVEVYGRP